MSLSDQALASAESAALRTEALESDAEKRVDQEFAAAAANGTDPRTSEAFRDWMAARADTDAAWGRWAVLMDARADSEAGASDLAHKRGG